MDFDRNELSVHEIMEQVIRQRDEMVRLVGEAEVVQKPDGSWSAIIESDSVTWEDLDDLTSHFRYPDNPSKEDSVTPPLFPMNPWVEHILNAVEDSTPQSVEANVEEVLHKYRDFIRRQVENEYQNQLDSSLQDMMGA